MKFPNLGDCHNIAIAFNREFKLPLCIFYGERISDGLREYILIHAGVLYQGSFVDELGVHGSPDSYLYEFLERNPEYSHYETFYFDSSEDSSLLSLLAKVGASVNEDKIIFFKNNLIHKIINLDE